MVVDMIDTCSSDGNNESETPSLVDPVSSDDEDSDSDDNDDAAGDAPTINHVLVLENSNLGRQETVNQDDENIINHIPVSENETLVTQETVNLETNISVTQGRRT